MGLLCYQRELRKAVGCSLRALNCRGEQSQTNSPEVPGNSCVQEPNLALNMVGFSKLLCKPPMLLYNLFIVNT